MAGAPPVDHDRLRTLWDVLAFHAEATPEAPALHFEGRETSYAALHAAAARFAGVLAAQGVTRGARVAYLGKNSDDYFILLYAAARLGAVLVPLNWRLAADEWAFILSDSGAVLLFADAEFLERARGLDTPATALVDTLALGSEAPGTAFPEPDDVVFQVYTSGTTGRPKGAMLTHRNMLALRAPGYRAGLAWFPGRGDTSLVVLPVAHIAGTAYALFGLYGGGRVVIARDFDPGVTLDLIERERGTHILLAPAAMRLVLDHPGAETRDCGSLRYITYGASPIPQALLVRAIERLGCGFVQMYGMTEAAGGVVALAPEDHVGDPALLRSCGRAMPGVEVAIMDEAGDLLSAEQPGEIVVRSAAVMPGYWHLAEETSRAITADGWLRTGDVGRMDAAGYVYVLDRTKDMIVSGGENVYPAEVENAIFGHPDVADVAVIGVPSARWGEEVMAIIVPRDGAAPDLQSIAGWARQRIAAFKVPRRIALVAELPRNAGQKILRRVLREPYWEGHDRRVN